MNRSHNFSAGPSQLPKEVIEEISDEIGEFQDTGMSVIEMSHRSKPYIEVQNQSIELIKELCRVPDDYEVLLLQGGATLQFTMIPLNYQLTDNTGSYSLSGTWANKAYKEAKKIGKTFVAWDGKDENYTRMPEASELDFPQDSVYLHVTSNETIQGVRYPNLDLGDHLVVDMSSDFLTRDIEWNNIDIVYAGAQKSLGPAGVTIVIVKNSVIDNSPEDLPNYLSFREHAKADSMLNTPPVFSIWAMSKMLKWTQSQGGLDEMKKRADAKSSLLYDAIDNSDKFYVNPVDRQDRSKTNIIFNLETPELEKSFLEQAEKNNLLNLKGHRSIGGIRASIYNGVQISSVETLVDFMNQFKNQN